MAASKLIAGFRRRRKSILITGKLCLNLLFFSASKYTLFSFANLLIYTITYIQYNSFSALLSINGTVLKCYRYIFGLFFSWFNSMHNSTDFCSCSIAYISWLSTQFVIRQLFTEYCIYQLIVNIVTRQLFTEYCI